MPVKPPPLASTNLPLPEPTDIFQAPKGVGTPCDITDMLTLPQSTGKAHAHNNKPPGIPNSLDCNKQHKSVATPPAWLEWHFIIKHIQTPFHMAHDRLESVLLFNINLGTLFAPDSINTAPTADLVVTCAWQFQRHDDNHYHPRGDPFKPLKEPLQVCPPVWAPIQEGNPWLWLQPKSLRPCPEYEHEKWFKTKREAVPSPWLGGLPSCPLLCMFVLIDPSDTPCWL